MYCFDENNATLTELEAGYMDGILIIWLFWVMKMLLS